MFVNVFAGSGSIIALTGVALGVAAIFFPGEARVGLLATGGFMVVFGLIFFFVGRRVGRLAGGLLGGGGELLETGRPGMGTITRMWDTGVTINEHPVFGFEMDVEAEGHPAYTAQVQQRVPRMLAGAILPGAKVGIKLDPERPEEVVIDWSQAPEGGAGAQGISRAAVVGGIPAAAAEALAAAGEAVSGSKISVEDLLRTGRRGTARITSARDVGEIGDLGLADRGDEKADDRLYIISMAVKLPGRSEYDAEVAHRVPDRLIGRVGPGVEVEIAADRDDPERSVAIDWDASGL